MNRLAVVAVVVSLIAVAFFGLGWGIHTWEEIRGTAWRSMGDGTKMISSNVGVARMLRLLGMLVAVPGICLALVAALADPRRTAPAWFAGALGALVVVGWFVVPLLF